VIADDEPRVRYALKALLAAVDSTAADGARQLQVVGEAGNGQEAVRIVAERRPDVVLMDARMPVMDGVAATRAIKEKWPLVRIVMLTMYADQEVEARAAGVDAFLLKGFAVPDLLKEVCGTA
jgi:DNA-binding NarL/FixJ family response regulator